MIKKETKSLLLSLALILVVALGFYTLHARAKKHISLFENSREVALASSAIPSNPEVAKMIAEPDDPPEGYVQYRNEKYGFYYYHSPQAEIKEYDEGHGAMTVVQENLDKMRGLQIFIVPYSGSVITEERFKKDVPSGIRSNIENTWIGYKEIPAVTFNSYDSILGETREVWFIYNGYLFEVTTFKGFGDWFSSIMKTWRFI